MINSEKENQEILALRLADDLVGKGWSIKMSTKRGVVKTELFPHGRKEIFIGHGSVINSLIEATGAAKCFLSEIRKG